MKENYFRLNVRRKRGQKGKAEGKLQLRIFVMKFFPFRLFFICPFSSVQFLSSFMWKKNFEMLDK